ncbi:DUF4192 family protein [Glycomyces sp. NRRL B-16210]|uniref:DUF4192 family protein n=1 Tax=Glycomyces sp. NRRL B-16210 TaxID=1463821 RepID=UPI0014152A93|nr:DUF4192 family protein [Glycomyces sp. NRRL B-16210]
MLDTLSGAELIGLAPYILERRPHEKLVIIGTYGGEPRAWTTWPLAALESGDTRRSMARDWATSEFDRLYLIGYSTSQSDTAARINQLHTELRDEGLETVNVTRNFVVNGRQWGYASYGGLVDGYEGTATVIAPDPVRGRVEGLLFRTSCRKRYAAARFNSLDPAAVEKAARIATQCHIDRDKVANPNRQAEIDEGRYRQALANPSAMTVLGAVALGIAAAQNVDLAADAVDDILDGAPAALDLWSEVARWSTGAARTTATALAALSAWKDRDEAAVAFAEIALDADPESGLAWAVWHVVSTGAAPEHVRACADFEAVAA